ncbi:MASE4 domain-containing protein [Paraherbaspirillum soli]|uniref:MASE4 domain-containing protein n=1 Tax=Paraherbaspirillum soli TaxID=631222 RepID=A0ABW0MC71_9BURK
MWICVAIALGTMLLIPVAGIPWPRFPAFLPAFQTAAMVAYFITAYLIFGHYRATGSVDLLYLSSGCLYTGGILVAQFLAMPGMFLPQGRLIGGDQTAIWLWVFWHAGPTMGMLFYAVGEWRRPGLVVTDSERMARRFGVVLVLALAASIAAVTVFHHLLPVLEMNGDFSHTTTTEVAPALQLMTAATLVLLWRVTRFRTVLQVWLGVALIALLFDNVITMAGGSRFSVGWYAGRFNALVAATVLLLIYLREINHVYLKTVEDARLLAASNALLEVKVDQARLDDLTGLPGRALFLELAETLRARSMLNGQAVAVLFIDLDGFKWVNDNMGHERGDVVLVEVAEALRTVLRDIDVAGRVGGDEFVVCLVAPAAVIKATATAVAGRIVNRVAAIGDGIGCSVGVTLCDADSLEWDSALRQADEAMYRAKRHGKSRFAVYDHPSFDEAALF